MVTAFKKAYSSVGGKWQAWKTYVVMEPVISISPSRIPLNNLASAGFEEESELGY